MTDSRKKTGLLFPFFIILKRDFINLATNVSLILSNTIFPLLLIFVLGYLGGGLYGGSDVTAYDYYGVTILIYSALNVSMTAANSFMDQNVKRSNLRILYAPIPKSFIYLSKTVATFLFTGLCSIALVALLQLVFNIRLGGTSAVYTAVVLLCFDLFSSALGVLFCCLFKGEELTNKILSIINSVLAILGGLFFQLDGLGRTAEVLSFFSPVKWVVETVLRIVYDGDFSLFLPTLLSFVIASLLLLWGCKRTFKTEDYI
ncbi:putative pleiotropic drug resistance protein 7 (plasmid) [Paenibacillus polymyxa M1]|uniref:ABC transporter permease n=1 Tax=Paenibacillus polymyxa TaxID=1406 RepID=UPI00021BBB15|nr:ABC transporter permease [Paenibacillus polymyxa]CCC86191.1 putative pleiotropic drug resistance protein 7 [Paenibacillus polymyxa M1]